MARVVRGDSIGAAWENAKRVVLPARIARLIIGRGNMADDIKIDGNCCHKGLSCTGFSYLYAVSIML